MRPNMTSFSSSTANCKWCLPIKITWCHNMTSVYKKYERLITCKGKTTRLQAAEKDEKMRRESEAEREPAVGIISLLLLWGLQRAKEHSGKWIRKGDKHPGKQTGKCLSGRTRKQTGKQYGQAHHAWLHSSLCMMMMQQSSIRLFHLPSQKPFKVCRRYGTPIQQRWRTQLPQARSTHTHTLTHMGGLHYEESIRKKTSLNRMRIVPATTSAHPIWASSMLSIIHIHGMASIFHPSFSSRPSLLPFHDSCSASPLPIHNVQLYAAATHRCDLSTVLCTRHGGRNVGGRGCI